MGTLQDARLTPRASSGCPGNAGPQMAHALNVQGVRVGAHVDQADEVIG
jgi:hypothetical protein